VTAPRLQPGYVVAGKYTIRAAVSYGGATATYAAQATPGRDLALKIYSPELSGRADVLAALQQATTVTNALPADSSGPILDSGFDPQTRAPYVVVEFVPLTTLAQAVAGGPLQAADVVLLLRGIARAVDAAHAQRLAHGGLKPQNIFLGPAPQRQVRVIDFGVATARAALPTSEGYALAAPWLAPEQLQPGAAGPGVDVFSAALVAFFAATARPYWLSCQGQTPDLARWHQEIAAPRTMPSTRAREIGAMLPTAFDPVFGRALSANPAERFASVGELAEAFARASAGGQAVVSDLGSTMAVDADAAFPGAPPIAAGRLAPAAAPPSPSMQAPPPRAALAPSAQALDPVALPERSKKGLYITLALLGVGLVAGVIALVVVSRAPKPDGATASTASAAPSASSPPSAVAALPIASAPPPPASATATTPTPTADTSAAAAPEAAELTIVCTPECDAVSIDDNALQDNLTDPMQLPAGTHTITVGKASYVSQTKKVTLKPGQKQKASFALFKPGPAPVPTKRCGKFLERCP
jgi:hypothetical protein